MPQASADMIDVRGYGLRVWSAGSGTPLVIFGDFFGPQGWQPYMDELARKHRVIVPEHPGFGGQPVPAWLDTVGDLANFHLDLFDRLDLRDVILLGCGAGGWAAADLAMRNSTRVASLVLVGPAGIHLTELPQPDIFLRGDEEGVRVFFHDAAVADVYVASTLGPESEDVRLQNNEMSARLTWEPRLHDPHLMKWLHRVTVPTLVVWGANDQVAPVGYASEWQKRLAKARVEIVPACGHAPHLEKPAAFVSLVDSFLATARG